MTLIGKSRLSQPSVRDNFAVACGLVVAVVLADCAKQPAAQAHAPGFLTGIFHGFVALVSLVASLFLHVRIYPFPNGGFWYDTGFVIGFSANVLILVILCMARIGGFVVTRGR